MHSRSHLHFWNWFWTALDRMVTAACTDERITERERNEIARLMAEYPGKPHPTTRMARGKDGRWHLHTDLPGGVNDDTRRS